MSVEWRAVVGFESLYEVSSEGQVRNSRTGHLLSLHVNGAEGVAKYVSVGLWRNNIPTYKYVHRIVAEAFIPNPENKQYVNHIDCNPKNNQVSNLEWCTASENMRHAAAMGVIKTDIEASRRNIQAYNAQHSIKVRRSDGEIYSSVRAAAAASGVTPDRIRRAIDTHKCVDGYFYERYTETQS